jgi:nitrogen regulatory protein P-II 1
MRLVEAIIPPSLLDDVKDRLGLVGVRGMTVHPVVAFGVGRGPTTKPFAMMVRLLVVAPEDMVETVINAIITVARRGDGHDGQIIVTPIVEAFRIRTGETGTDAL